MNNMTKMFLGLGLSVLISLPVLAALKSGDKAPVFSAQASLAGKEFNFSLADALKKGPVVVYFYPSAFTKGCDLEAHTFAEMKDQFDAAGATIIGVSADSIARLNQFSADPEYCAGKFPVASDAKGDISSSYNLNKTAVKPGQADVRGVAIDHDFIERDHVRHRQRRQDRHDIIVEGRRPLTRRARKEIIGDRAGPQVQIAAARISANRCCRNSQDLLAWLHFLNINQGGRV